MTDHPTPGSPLSADDVGLLKLIEGLADRGHKTPGCENWRAVSMCRQISDIVARRLPTDRRAEAENGHEFNPNLSMRGEGDCMVCGRHQSDHPPEAKKMRRAEPGWLARSLAEAKAEADTPPSAGPDAGAETFGWLVEHTVAESMFIRPPAFCPAGANYKITELVTRQSAAAALEAAAEREGQSATKLAEVDFELRAKKHELEIADEQIARLTDRATRAEAQVADRDKRIAELREALEPFAAIKINGEQNSSEIVPNGYSSATPWRAQVEVARQALSAIPTPGRSE